MSQSRLLSFIEATANTLVGFLTGIATQLVVFHFFNINVPFKDNFMIGLIFTVVSLIRSYIIRRYFNGLKFKNG